MNQPESSENRSPLSLLGSRITRMVQRTERSLSPWARRTLQRDTAGETLGDTRPSGATGATAQRSMVLFDRIQRTANRSNVWNKRAESISAPAQSTDNFASGVLQRFPETAAKYERQATGGKSSRGGAPAATAMAPEPSPEAPQSAEVPGPEALGTDIASATFQDIRDRIQRAQRGEDAPAQQGPGTFPPPRMPAAEEARERNPDAPRRPSFTPPGNAMPSEQVSRMSQPERMRIRRFTHIEEVTAGSVARAPVSGQEPGREPGPSESETWNAEASIERPARPIVVPGPGQHEQRAPQNAAGAAGIQRKASIEPAFRPLPKPAALPQAGATVLRQPAEPRPPDSEVPSTRSEIVLPDVPAARPEDISDDATSSVQRLVAAAMPLVNAIRRGPAEDAEEAESGSDASAPIPTARPTSAPRVQRKKSGAATVEDRPASTARGTIAPMTVARPTVSRGPAEIQREQATEDDESGEDEIEDAAPSMVDQAENETSEPMESDDGRTEAGSEAPETETDDNESDFPLRRSVIQRTPAENLGRENDGGSASDTKATPMVQRGFDGSSASDSDMATERGRGSEGVQTARPQTAAPGIQRTELDKQSGGAQHSPLTRGAGRSEAPLAHSDLQPSEGAATRTDLRASEAARPAVQRVLDSASKSEPPATDSVTEVFNDVSAATSNVAGDSSPVIRRVVDPSQPAVAPHVVRPIERDEPLAEPESPAATPEASIRRQVDQAMPLRSIPPAVEPLAAIDNAPAGDLPSVQRKLDEGIDSIGAGPSAGRGDYVTAPIPPAATMPPQVSIDSSGPVSVRRQVDQAMPLRAQARETPTERVGTDVPSSNDSQHVTKSSIQRAMGDVKTDTDSVTPADGSTQQVPTSVFRKVPPTATAVQRIPADAPQDESSSEMRDELPEAEPTAPKTEPKVPQTVQRSAGGSIPMQARPRAARPGDDGGSALVAPSIPATPGGADVIRRQADLPGAGGTTEQPKSGPELSAPLTAISASEKTIQKSPDRAGVPPAQPGPIVSRPAATGSPELSAPRAFATTLSAPIVQRQSQRHETHTETSFTAIETAEPRSRRGESSSVPQFSGMSATGIQRAPADNVGGDARGESAADAMPLVHPFGRVTPQPQTSVQRELQEGLFTVPEVTFGQTTHSISRANASSPSGDTMTLRRMPSVTPSAVIQRSPQTVTYISPMASGDGTIQRADAKPGTTLSPASKKKDEKKDDKKDEKPAEKAEPPDLDTLAKQILPLLKRMLVVERERHVRR